ncbi:MAG: PHP domain-containing protein [Clostridia bacterium]|nr:PHP domain-containing protein [Clostridia bacterium]
MERIQVDLHMHTVASDGTQTPQALLDEVIEKDIKIFSVTDHDSVDSIAEMMVLAKKTDRVFIPGVEISAMYDDKEIHLLTYGLLPDHEMLMGILKRNRAIREAFNIKIIEHIKKVKHFVSLEAYLNYERDPSWGGWKAENYLRDIGAIHHLGDLFAMLHDMEEQMVFPLAQDILPKLKSAGATVFLAHPPAYCGGELVPESMLDELTEMGIDGIECFSPYYKLGDQSDYYVSYCKTHDLMISCGSDYHGSFIATRHMGHPNKTLNELKIDQLLKNTSL